MKSQEDHRSWLLLPLPKILSWLFASAVFLVKESPHLELNEADLIAVITMILARFVRKDIEDSYNLFSRLAIRHPSSSPLSYTRYTFHTISLDTILSNINV